MKHSNVLITSKIDHEKFFLPDLAELKSARDDCGMFDTSNHLEQLTAKSSEFQINTAKANLKKIHYNIATFTLNSGGEF